MADRERSKKSISNRLYDKLKVVALIVLPSLASFYFVIATIWDLPNTAEILGTISAIDALLGGSLKVAYNKYYRSGANFDGEIIVTPEDGGNKAMLVADKMIEDLVDQPGKHSLEFRVMRQKVSGS